MFLANSPMRQGCREITFLRQFYSRVHKGVFLQFRFSETLFRKISDLR